MDKEAEDNRTRIIVLHFGEEDGQSLAVDVSHTADLGRNYGEVYGLNLVEKAGNPIDNLLVDLRIDLG